MTVHAKIGDNDELVIQIQGVFDFTQYQEFTDGYQKFDRIFKKYTVDLTETKTIDNSALGMFLLLRDFAGGDSSDISLLNPNALIKENLEASKFEKLFNIIK